MSVVYLVTNKSQWTSFRARVCVTGNQLWDWSSNFHLKGQIPYKLSILSIENPFQMNMFCENQIPAFSCFILRIV